MRSRMRPASSRLRSASSLLEGGASGPAIRPGKPDASLLVSLISGDKPRMPKVGPPLDASQVAVIRRWIEEGARDDSNRGGDELWWSLKPLNRPPVPSMSDKWGSTPIDAFIMERLRAAGIEPSPEADRRILIRRVYFDLHGLPPSPSEIDAFVNDPAPDAYEKLVDRLLASERYGERWARHWFDVIHYGESHGYDKDKPRLNAWPYRDYVIRALNTDKPYARFVQEQIAGDVMFPNSPQALVATGFLSAGPWDFVGHRSCAKGRPKRTRRERWIAMTWWRRPFPRSPA